jgi:hypothetical protein
MAGQLPQITPPPELPPKPDGIVVRLWNALFPGAAVPEEPAADEGPWYRAAFRPWSLPMRVAVFVACVLLAIVVFCWWEFRTNPYHVPWRYSLTPLRAITVLLLLLVVPVSVYQALKLWFQGEKSQFPDIDAAWQAGKEALRKQGLDLGDRPLFLVLGSPGPEQERALFETSKSAVIVRGVPEGPAPLHWYATADRIYLCCTGASWLSALSALIARRGVGRGPAGRGALPRGTEQAEMERISATIQPHAFIHDEPAFGGASNLGKSSSSIKLEKFAAAQQAAARAEPKPAAAPTPLHGGALEGENLAIIQPSDAAEQEDRLESVCELLKTARYPFSPVNGCVTLVPFAAAGANTQEIEELAKAINTDLLTLHRTLHLRFPVTAIFTGMQEEPGFRELMRRVGPERCAANRFGMGYDLRSPASSGEIGAFSAHVCGAFEDWVYGLFREDQVLKRPGNSFLFSLLCRIRSSFKDRLAELLSQGFGYNDRLKPEDAPFLFSGCYFVASGATEDQRAFIQGVSEKLDGEQDRLEWSRHAITSSRRGRGLAIFASILIAVLAVHLVLMIFMHPPGH